MGCDCSPPQITAAGNAGRTRTFRLFSITVFRWVATTCSSEQQGLYMQIIQVLQRFDRGCNTSKKGKRKYV